MRLLLTLVLFLRGIAASIETSNFLRNYVFLSVLHHPGHNVNASQPSSVVEFGFLRDQCLLSLI